MNYAAQYNALQRRYESLLADVRQVLGLLRRRRTRAALSLLESALDGDESDMSGRAESEPEATDEPMTVEDVQAALLSQVPAPAPPVAFVGRCFCLDDAPGAQPPVGDAPDSAASDGSQEPMCCRCGDRENLHVFARSGVWLDVESEAARTYCVDCLNG